jgi:integrase
VTLRSRRLDSRSDELPGDWLFPSTRTGKQLSKSPQFKGCAEVLTAAGLMGPSATGGGYKLRNTFAVRQLGDKKYSDAEVAAWLGIDESEMARYRRVMTSPIDVR